MSKKTQTLSISTMVGTKVRHVEGDDLGKIEDIAIDATTGHISYVVLSLGGFLGIGSRHHAVPWSTLRVDSENEQFLLDVDKELLKNGPSFEANSAPDDGPEWAERIYQHYGQPPHWEELSVAEAEMRRPPT